MHKLAILSGLAGAAVIVLAGQASARSGTPYRAHVYAGPYYGSVIPLRRRSMGPNADWRDVYIDTNNGDRLVRVPGGGFR